MFLFIFQFQTDSFSEQNALDIVIVGTSVLHFDTHAQFLSLKWNEFIDLNDDMTPSQRSNVLFMLLIDFIKASLT